jgi:hypothetical protein
MNPVNFKTSLFSGFIQVAICHTTTLHVFTSLLTEGPSLPAIEHHSVKTDQQMHTLFVSTYLL